MAQVQMTAAQRDLLIADPNFVTVCKQAIMDQAVYTQGQDGTSGLTTATLAKQWALWRPWSAQIIANPSLLSDSSIAYQFAMFISKRQLTCWDNVANTTAAAITWLQSNNYLGANALSQDWFNLKTSLSVF